MSTDIRKPIWSRRDWIVFAAFWCAVPLVVLAIAAPAIMRARTGAWPIKSASQMRNIVQGIFAFEEDHGRPLELHEWPDALVQGGYIEEEWLLAPGDRGPGSTYTYVPLAPGETRIGSASRVLLYERLEWFDESQGNICFEDSHIGWYRADEWRIAVETRTMPEALGAP